IDDDVVVREEQWVASRLADRVVARVRLAGQVASRVTDRPGYRELVDHLARRRRRRAVVDDDELVPTAGVVAREDRPDARLQEVGPLARGDDHADDRSA